MSEQRDGDRCSECGAPMKPGYRYSRCCAAPVINEEPEETCEFHDVPMIDGVCSCCLADSAHDGR